ncbi:MAG TPA: two-component regulator propeller domain-containing protein [Cytophagales bacterium]|nr:two-component regulator propeller domain-containing protein [Cytophagales bacterium]
MSSQIFRFLLLSITLSSIFPKKINGQHKDIKFQHLTVEHGLAGNTVNSVIRDSKGFIWISTENGISRYDGISSVNFRSNEEDTCSISSNITYVVFEDKKKRLWVGSEKGLDLFDRTLDKFDRHFFKDIPVRAIYQDSKGNLWIGSDKGLYLFKESEKKFFRPFSSIFNETNIVYNTIPSITEDQSGNLWIGTSNGGVITYNFNTKILKKFTHQAGKSGSLSSDNVRKILCTKDNTIWVATYGGGINKFQQDTETFFVYAHNPANIKGIANNAITTMWEDEKGKLWIGTDGNGIDIFDPATNEFYHVVPSHYNSRSLNNNVVRSINGDGRGGIWIGTYAGGVNFYNQNTEGFFHYKVPTFNGNNSVMSFAEDKKGNLWIATDGGGLSYFNRITGKFFNYSHQLNNTNSLSDNRVLSLLLDEKGILWIGTYLGGLCTFDTRTKTFKRYSMNDNSGLSDNIIWALLKDSNQQTWVGTNNGLNLYDPKTDKFKSINIDNSNLSNNMIRSLFEDDQKQLWVGTQEGLNVFNETTNNFTVIKSDLQKQNTLSNHWIRTINQDKNGNLWIGTFDGGLNLYDISKNIFKPFKESDGLPDNMISGIIPDGENIWISTGKGLARLDLKVHKIKNYYAKDGLQDNQFNINSYFITKKGEFLFGGINGFTLFVPDVIKKVQNNLHAPAIALTSFKIFNKEIVPDPKGAVLKTTINETKEITLSYDQSVITFEFAALNFIQPENNKYAYRLIGFEDGWNYIDNKRSATYTNLDPGTYIFQVKAANNDNIWNKEGRSVTLNITPPFWDTWWFKSLIGIILLSIGLIIINIIRLRFLEKIRINKLIAELEIKALIAQMNPHFIFNCLTSIQELIMVNKQEEAMHYLHQFSRLLRTVLESSEKNFIPLEQELTLLELYLELESMRFDKQFHYEISAPSTLDPEEIIIPSFLIQPFVENALWHGLMHKKGERNLFITFNLINDDLLSCKISDNGIGREAAGKIKKSNINSYQSMGIKIIKERMKIMKMQFDQVELLIDDEKDEDGNALGTTVTINLPLGMNEETGQNEFEIRTEKYFANN